MSAVLLFGKYAGRSITDVYNFDPSYLKHVVRMKYMKVGFMDLRNEILKLIEIDNAKKKRTSDDER